MIEKNLANKIAEASPLEGYESLPFEEKNNGKYYATFPYPYMNGYLHLGKYHFLLFAVSNSLPGFAGDNWLFLP